MATDFLSMKTKLIYCLVPTSFFNKKCLLSNAGDVHVPADTAMYKAVTVCPQIVSMFLYTRTDHWV